MQWSLAMKTSWIDGLWSTVKSGHEVKSWDYFRTFGFAEAVCRVDETKDPGVYITSNLGKP
jgi:hypothetical protein